VFARLSGNTARLPGSAGGIAELGSIGLTGLAVPKPQTQSLEEYLAYLHWFDGEIISLFR